MRIIIVRLAGKFYDPLGFLSPMIIKLFQKLCRLDSDWDEVIPEDWWENRMTLSQISISLHQCRLLEATCTSPKNF